MYEDVACSCYTHDDNGRGRIEKHCYELITLSASDSQCSDVQAAWAGLRSLVRITCTRLIAGQRKSEVRCFISIKDSARQVLRAVIQHWNIEDRLHYVLDVNMAEEDGRICKE